MNTNKYAVSIILPCCNVSQYIERAIDSILIQDFKDYEIIIINDGSTDNLLQKCDDLGYTEKGYIKILSFKNQGLSQARNEGLKIAQGEYVYFFDPDDYINQGMLSKVYLKAKEGNYDAVHFGFQTIYEDQGGIHYDKAESPYVYQTNDEIIHNYLPRFLGITQDNINSFQRKHQEGSDGRKKEYIPRGQPVFRHFLNNLLWRLFPPLTAFYQCRP